MSDDDDLLDLDAPPAFDTFERELSGSLDAHTTAQRQMRDALGDPHTLQMTTHEELGRGGMGSVARVWDEVLQREVARKTSLLDNIADHSALVREARITGLLEHPYVLPVHALASDTHRDPYFTMKLVRGQTLRALLDDEALDLVEGLEILRKICDALGYAHERGIVHHDLKPENIMVGTFGQVYLMDWGAALVFSPERLEAAIPHACDDDILLSPPSAMGTMPYLPPEVHRDPEQDGDERVDIYALGVMLHEILTGSLPQITGGVPLPPSLFADIPGRLEQLLLDALEASPERRLRSAGEFRDRLGAFLHGRDALDILEVGPGVTLFSPGDQARRAYILEAGRCARFELRDGVHHHVEEASAISVLGEVDMLKGRRHGFGVQTLTHCRLRILTPRSLAHSVRGIPDWGVLVLQSLAENLD